MLAVSTGRRGAGLVRLAARCESRSRPPGNLAAVRRCSASTVASVFGSRSSGGGEATAAAVPAVGPPPLSSPMSSGRCASGSERFSFIARQAYAQVGMALSSEPPSTPPGASPRRAARTTTRSAPCATDGFPAATAAHGGLFARGFVFLAAGVDRLGVFLGRVRAGCGVSQGCGRGASCSASLAIAEQSASKHTPTPSARPASR